MPHLEHFMQHHIKRMRKLARHVGLATLEYLMLMLKHRKQNHVMHAHKALKVVRVHHAAYRGV
jgi:hypothetical protein